METEQHIIGLPDATRQVVYRHLDNRIQIERIWNIRDFLIDQIQTKKCSLKRGVYKAYDKKTDTYMRTYFCFGDKGYSTWNVFPSSFNCVWENLMCQELKERGDDLEWDFIAIYYGWDKPIFVKEKASAQDFDRKALTLSADQILTEGDIHILDTFRDLLSALFERVIKENVKTEKIVEEYKRWKKLLAKLK